MKTELAALVAAAPPVDPKAKAPEESEEIMALRKEIETEEMNIELIELEEALPAMEAESEEKTAAEARLDELKETLGLKPPEE
jgi:hypothetical protein